MATLKLEVTAIEAPFSTQMWRYDKGVEHLYYARLFASSRSYADKPQAWRTWFNSGFHVGSRGYNPAATESDRLTKFMKMAGKVLELQFASGNKAALEDLRGLVQKVDGLRKSLPKDEEARAKALEQNTEIQREVFTPVVSRLKQGGFQPEEIDAFVRALRRGLVALTDDEITGIKISLN